MRCWSPRIRAARRLSELRDHAPDEILVPSHNRHVINAACEESQNEIARLVPGSLLDAEQGIVTSDASNIYTGGIMP